MIAALILPVVVLGAALQCCAQDPPAGAAQDLEKEFLDTLAEAGIEFDREAKTATIPAMVNRLGDPLEYALIHRRGKTHEALLITEVQPSIMNAALLALGLEPGKNATYKEKDPPPTREEVEAGADFVDVFPPEGMPLYLTVSWTTETEDGKEERHEEAIEDLILDMTTGETVDTMQWIFLGGRMAALYRGDPPVFVADYEGNMVSICYLDPPNHLATMKHERARDDMIWWRTEKCPAPGVEVKVTFHKNKPKAVEEREKRLKGGGGD